MMGWYDTKPGYLHTYIKDYVTLYVKNIRTLVLEVSSWTSLVVQSLRFHASSAGAACWIPGRGAEILYASQCDQKQFLKKQWSPKLSVTQLSTCVALNESFCVIPVGTGILGRKNRYNAVLMLAMPEVIKSSKKKKFRHSSEILWIWFPIPQ